MTDSRPTEESRPAVSAGVSVRDLLAACAAAETISRPPQPPERPAGARAATVAPQTADDPPRHPRAAA
ncbi:hypothetical protein AB0G54_23540 [Streptomyces yokosukanensis]|nr:hypothetical protein [Streptomyces yokosukanensis]